MAIVVSVVSRPRAILGECPVWHGEEGRHMAPAPFAAFIEADSRRWGEAVRVSGAVAE